MPDQNEGPRKLTIAEHIPPAKVVGEFAAALPMLLPEVAQAPGQIISALSVTMLPTFDREAG